MEGGAPRTASEGDSPEPETVGSGPDGAFPANPCAYDAGLRCAPTTPASGVCLRPGLRRAPLGRWNLGACFPGAGNAGRLEIRRGPTGRWCGAWIGGAAGGGPGGVRCAPDRGGGRRPAGTGRRSRAATPSSSAPPSRPSRPPNPRTARTRSSVLGDRDHRRAVFDRRFPRAIRSSLRIPIGFIMKIRRLVRVSWPCRSRYATSGARSRPSGRRRRPGGAPPAGPGPPFQTTATGVRQDETGDLTSRFRSQGGCRGHG